MKLALPSPSESNMKALDASRFWWHEGIPWWWHPASITFFNLSVYCVLRLIWGGSNYLPGKVWYALCFIIPVFVGIGIASGNLCVPLRCDWQTLFHVGAALLYIQLDLLVARWFSSGEKFGSINAPGLFLSKLTLTPKLGDGGMPPVLRSIAEFNGALMHEIFWNVCICQNLINHGFAVPIALAAVPVVSCALHAVTCNNMQGICCAPQFCWVALAYHASGSVLPSGFIHAMWYITDGKMLALLSTLKRDWDFEKRIGESSTPLPGKPFFCGWLLILTYYALLTLLTYHYPVLRSDDAAHIADCRFGKLPSSHVDWVVMTGSFLQAVAGVATWSIARIGMDIVADTGDATTNGMVRVEKAVMARLGKSSPFQENESLPSYSGSMNEGAPLQMKHP